MKLGEANIVLRHRPGLEVVDLTLRFVRALNPSAFFNLAVLVLLPAFGSCLLAANTLDLDWPLLWILALGVTRLVEIPFIILSGELLFQREVKLRSILTQSLQVLPKVAFALFLYAFLMALSLLVVVGPLFVGASYFFLSELLILEKSGPIGAFKRSSRFLSGRSGVGLEGMMMRSALLVTFVVLGETLGQAVLEHGLSLNHQTQKLWSDGGSAFALFGLFAFVPYGAAHRFLSYINERTRQDGWDVQVAFLALKNEAGVTEAGAKHAP